MTLQAIHEPPVFELSEDPQSLAERLQAQIDAAESQEDEDD